MATLANRIGLRWEVGYPFLFGIAGAIGAAIFAPRAFIAITMNGWDASVIYWSSFDLASIFTGFLFTFYTFVITTDRGFIARARSSLYYRMAMSYTLRALILGAILAVLSIPMMLIVPTPMTHDVWLFVVAAWVGLTVYTFAAFVRAAHIFWIFASQHR